jgi:[acyl-carrier-protein] S-malonyltransferase
MAEVSDKLAAAFEQVTWSDAQPPVVSNVTAEPVSDADRIRSLLAEQVRSPVEWVASVRRMVEEGVDTFLECGPGSALTGMVKRIAPGTRTLNVADVATLDASLHALAAAPVEASA